MESQALALQRDSYVQQDFPIEEYRSRAERARSLMNTFGFDALMVTGDFCSAHNYRYLSGHLPRDFQANSARPHILVLPKEGEPIIVAYCLTERDAQVSSWVKDVRSYTQPFTFELVRNAIKDLGRDRAKIGAELGVEQRMAMPFREFHKLEREFPDLRFEDASELLWSMRMVKSPKEIECIAKADEINGKALEYCFNELHEGDTEIDAAKKVCSYMINAGAYRPPHDQVTVNSGPEWRTGFIAPKNKPLAKGDVVFIDSGCTINGYWGEFNRMATVGAPSERQKKNQEMIMKIVQGSLKYIKAGVKSSEVMKQFVNKYKEFGLDPPGYYLKYPFMHLAHEIGLESSEPMLIRMDSDIELKAGMVFSVEAYYKDVENYGSEEDIVVTEDGCRVLSKMDEGLYVIH